MIDSIIMNSDNLEKEILQVVAIQFSCDSGKISSQTEFAKDLNATDSHLVDLTMALEEKFNLQIPDEEMGKMLTVGHVVNYVRENKN